MIKLYDGQAPYHVPHDPDQTPTLTPYLVPNARAAVIVCPGGGYHNLAPHEGEPIAQWLNTLGISSYVLLYRRHPHRHPAPLSDALRAIRIVRSKGFAKVGILGFSAGGHCACSAATLFTEPTPHDDLAHISARPDLAILCYPVITFGNSRHDGSLRALLGDQPDPALQHKLSLENAVTPQTPPTFIWHTADDGAVPVENAYLLAMKLREHKVPHELHVYQSGRHGLGLAKEHAAGAWPAACAVFLKSHEFTSLV